MSAKPLILVTGATGHQGSAVANALLELEFPVRAFVHNAERLEAKALASAGAEVVSGDFDDRSSLDRAMQGVAGVFSMQEFLKAGIEGEILHGKAVADAAKAAGVAHFVYSSVGGADRRTGIPHFESKWQIEEHVRALGIPHTILRPVFFYFNYDSPQMRQLIDSGVLASPLSPDRDLAQICETDYGRMVATVCAEREKFLGREIECASTKLNMPQVAEAFAKVLRRPVRYEQIPWDEFEQRTNHEMARMYRWFEDQGYQVDLAELKREFGELTDLETYLKEQEWLRASTSPRRSGQPEAHV